MKLGAAHRGDLERSRHHVEPLEISGYRLLERREGPGEVWSAVGPGGVRTALRIVRPDPDFDCDDMSPDRAALAVRHPNLQSCLGLWSVGGALVLASEWPDRSLWDRFREAVAAGHCGVPRNELLEVLTEAARALDYLNALAYSRSDAPRSAAQSGPGIPHGDVAPRTLLYFGGGVKLADLDPIRRVRLVRHESGTPLTPLYPAYAAPERLEGDVSRHSDQYSLAMTYGHLLTGRMIAPEDLSELPEDDRALVARALHADPDRRWPSSRAFLLALYTATASAAPPQRSTSPALALATEPLPFVEFTADLLASKAPRVRTFHGRDAAALAAMMTVAAGIALVVTFWILQPTRAASQMRVGASHVSAPPAPVTRVRFQSSNVDRVSNEDSQTLSPLALLPERQADAHVRAGDAVLPATVSPVAAPSR
jgi:serine/threonine protein kinase